jgi:membrane protein required for colicin V production
MLPDDPESTILKRLKRPKDGEGEEPAAGQQRSDSTTPGPARNSGEGYERSDRSGMRQLIETRAAPAR